MKRLVNIKFLEKLRKNNLPKKELNKLYGKISLKVLSSIPQNLNSVCKVRVFFGINQL